MQTDPSVHDNFVYAYNVDCEEQRIVLHTAFRDREPHEFTDIVFRNVVAHHFEHVLPDNILFDVDEADVAAVVRDNEQLLRESWRHDWPLEYDGNLVELVELLKASLVRAFVIHSSFGLSGWVFAGSCDRVSRDEPAKIT